MNLDKLAWNMTTTALRSAIYARLARNCKVSLYAGIGQLFAAAADQINATNTGSLRAKMRVNLDTILEVDGVNVTKDDTKKADQTLKNVLTSYLIYFDTEGRGAKVRDKYATFRDWCKAPLSQKDRAKEGLDVEVVADKPYVSFTDILTEINKPAPVAVSVTNKINEEIAHVLFVLTGTAFTLDQIQNARLTEAPALVEQAA